MKERSMKLNLKILGINDKQKNKKTNPKFIDTKIEKEFTSLQVEKHKIIKYVLNVVYIIDLLVKITLKLFPENPEYFICSLIFLVIYSTLIIFKIFFLKNVVLKDSLDKAASLVVIFSLGFNTVYAFYKPNLYTFFRLRSGYFFFAISLIEIIFSYNFNIWINLSILFVNLFVFLFCLFTNPDKNEMRYYEIIISFMFFLIINFYKAKEMAFIRDHFIQKFRLKKFYYYSDDLINNLNGFQFTLKNKNVLIMNDNFLHCIEKSVGIKLDKKSNYHIPEKTLSIKNIVIDDIKNNKNLTNNLKSLNDMKEEEDICGFEKVVDTNRELSENNFFNKAEANENNEIIKQNYNNDIVIDKSENLKIEIAHKSFNLQNIYNNDYIYDTYNNCNVNYNKPIVNFPNNDQNPDSERKSLFNIPNQTSKISKNLNNSNLNVENNINNSKKSNPKSNIDEINRQSTLEQNNLITAKALEFIKSLKPCKFENISINNFDLSDNDCEKIVIGEKSDSINEKLSTMNLLELSFYIESEKNIEIKGNKFLFMGEFINENRKYFQVYYRKLPDYNNIVDFIIYDITHVKEAEKIETTLKTKFFAKIAHEFKTPITTIIGLVKTIKEDIEINSNFNNKENNFCSNCQNFMNNNNNSINNKENIRFDLIKRSRENICNLFKKNSSRSKNFDAFIPTENSNNNINNKDGEIFDFDKEALEEDSYKSKALLDQIENLCNYTIFLINDIIEYSKINKNDDNNFEIQQRDSKTEEKNNVNSITNNNNNLSIRNNANPINNFTNCNANNKNNKLNNSNVKAKEIKINFDKRQSILFVNVNQEAVNLFEISKFCRDVAETLLISKNKEDSVKLILNVDEKIKEKIIKSDPYRLKQILLNYLSNSVKFTKSGFICIKISLFFCDVEKAEKIKISVIDTGIGISEAEIKLLFQDNVMLNSAKSYNETGSGLGLSISRSLAKKLGHRLEVKSEYGKGSEFSIILDCENKIDYNNFNNFSAFNNSINFNNNNQVNLINTGNNRGKNNNLEMIRKTPTNNSNVVFDKSEINFNDIYNNFTFEKNETMRNGNNENNEICNDSASEEIKNYEQVNSNIIDKTIKRSQFSTETIKTICISEKDLIYRISEADRKVLNCDNSSFSSSEQAVKLKFSAKSSFNKQPKIFVNNDPFYPENRRNTINYMMNKKNYLPCNDNNNRNEFKDNIDNINIRCNNESNCQNKKNIGNSICSCCFDKVKYCSKNNFNNSKYLSCNKILGFNFLNKNNNNQDNNCNENFRNIYNSLMPKENINNNDKSNSNNIQNIPRTNNFYLSTYIINSYKSSSNKSINSIQNKKSTENIPIESNNNANTINCQITSINNTKLLLPTEQHMDSFNFEINSRKNSLSEQNKSKFTKKDNTNGKLLILIVDDHKFIRSTLKSLVNKVLKEKKMEAEFDVLEGRDGADIIYQLVNDQSNNNRIRCVITDENMEYLNGSAAIQIIRKLEKERKIRNVPIASITAFEDESSKDVILKAGANIILSKPCNNKSILKFLEDYGIFENK